MTRRKVIRYIMVDYGFCIDGYMIVRRWREASSAQLWSISDDMMLQNHRQTDARACRALLLAQERERKMRCEIMRKVTKCDRDSLRVETVALDVAGDLARCLLAVFAPLVLFDVSAAWRVLKVESKRVGRERTLHGK